MSLTVELTAQGLPLIPAEASGTLVGYDRSASQVNARESPIENRASRELGGIGNQGCLVLHVAREVSEDRGFCALNGKEITSMSRRVVDIERPIAA